MRRSKQVQAIEKIDRRGPSLCLFGAVLRGRVSNRVGHEYRWNWSESRVAVNGRCRLDGWALAELFVERFAP
uniref:Uncharacterized protein n=1 Tax=Romanomermis culicivorax TaxID=13658 RepID=A0A915K3Q6_ROMCU